MIGSSKSVQQFARQTFTATAIVFSVALLLLFVWFAADLLLLLFAGLLVSILLCGLSRAIREYIRIPRAASVTLAATGLIAFVAISAWMIVGQIGGQASELAEKLPQAIEALRNHISSYNWAREAMDKLPDPSEWVASRRSTVIAQFTGAASTTLSALVNLVLLAVVGLYFAFQPEIYSHGAKRLLPIRYRQRAEEVLREVGDALWRWLIGRFGLMVLNAVLTSAGLWLLGVPLFLTLGLLAGLLNFIPNIGPWIAAVPAVLVGLLESPAKAVQVGILYLILQGLDGYVLTPLVDRRSVKLPPVLTISAQVLLGATFGFLGLLLASPVTTTVMIVVRMVYVEDVLEDRSQQSVQESGPEFHRPNKP